MFKSIARLLIIAIAIVIIIFVIGYGSFMGVYYYTSTPEFCSSCHYVEPYVISWASSSHQDVNCLDCHEPTSLLGKLHSKARGLNYYISDKTGNYVKPIIDASFISEERCFGCHIGEIKDYPNVKKITGNKEHLQYIKDEQKCTSCHNNVGHDTNIEIEKVFN